MKQQIAIIMLNNNHYNNKSVRVFKFLIGGRRLSTQMKAFNISKMYMHKIKLIFLLISKETNNCKALVLKLINKILYIQK